MTKFASIWGDLTVGNVSPAKEEDAPPAVKVDKKPKDIVEKVDGDTEGEENPPVATATAAVVEEEVEAAEREAISFEDEEIEKAYNLLIDEGVLDEPAEGAEGFDVSPEGLADAIAAVTRKNVAAEIAAIPESVQQFYAHVMEGKEPSSFKLKTAIVWDEVNMDLDSNKELALTQFYVNQGMSLEEAQEEVEDVKVANKLDKKSDIARESLAKIQTSARTARKEKADAAAAKQTDTSNKEVEALRKSIDDLDTIAGFKPDAKKKEQFKDYLFKVKPRTGKTQMQENMASEDRRMNIAFLDFVDYTKADLKREVQTDMAKTRKKKLTRYSDKGVRGSNSSKSVTTKTDAKKGKINFPTIFGHQSVDIED